MPSRPPPHARFVFFALLALFFGLSAAAAQAPEVRVKNETSALIEVFQFVNKVPTLLAKVAAQEDAVVRPIAGSFVAGTGSTKPRIRFPMDRA